MTMEQLSEKSGVTPRTIRYYVTQNLLPAPAKGCKDAYSENHLGILLRIKSFQAEGKSLDEIRAALAAVPTRRFIFPDHPVVIKFLPIPMEPHVLWKVTPDVTVQCRSDIPDSRFQRVVKAMEVFSKALQDE